MRPDLSAGLSPISPPVQLNKHTAASVRRGQGCPVLDTAHSSWLQQSHCRAWLSLAAKVVASLGKSI